MDIGCESLVLNDLAAQPCERVALLARKGATQICFVRDDDLRKFGPGALAMNRRMPAWAGVMPRWAIRSANRPAACAPSCARRNAAPVGRSLAELITGSKYRNYLQSAMIHYMNGS